MRLTPAEALRIYRRRAGVEHLIPLLKRITGIKPICVWKRESADGAMIPALLAEAAVAMARYCMEGEDVEDTDMEGSRISGRYGVRFRSHAHMHVRVQEKLSKSGYTSTDRRGRMR